MRIIVDQDQIEGVLDGSITKFIVPTGIPIVGTAQAKSFGYGVKEYSALEWQTDEGLKWIHKGQRYEFASGVDQPTLGKIFIRGIDKDDYLHDVHIRHLGFRHEHIEEAKAAFVEWWNNKYPSSPFYSMMRYWEVHFALVTDPEC